MSNLRPKYHLPLRTMALALLSIGILSSPAIATTENPEPVVPEIAPTSVPDDFPESLAQEVLQDIATQTEQPTNEFQITSAQRHTWMDGCMGIHWPTRACTMALVPGWIVTVERDGQEWTYHTDDRTRVVWNRNPVERPNDRLPVCFSKLCVLWDGSSQETPLLPDEQTGNGFRFIDVPSGLWYDPPTTYGFHFQTTSNSLFTDILDFPKDIDADNRFSVSFRDRVLGEFGPGESLDFITLLGQGVPEFTVTDIDPFVDGDDPLAFPIQLAFDTERASFQMTPLDAPQAEAVPEPTTLLGVVGTGLWVYRRRRRRSQNNDSHS